MSAKYGSVTPAARTPFGRIRTRLAERDSRTPTVNAPYASVEAPPRPAIVGMAAGAMQPQMRPLAAIVVNAEFGAALSALLRQRRLSQGRVGKAAGYNHSYVSRLAGGTRQPTREAVIRLAAALDATPAQRAALLQAAGFHSETPHLDPTVADLAALLGDAGVSEFVRETVRQQVTGAVWLARQQERAAA